MEIQSGFSVRDSRLSFLCHVAPPPCPATLFLPRIKETCTTQHDVDHPIGKVIELILERFYFRIEWSLPFLLSLLYLSWYLPSFFLFHLGIIIFLFDLFNDFSSKFFYFSESLRVFSSFFLYFSIKIFVGIFKAFPISLFSAIFSNWFASYFLYHIFRNFVQELISRNPLYFPIFFFPPFSFLLFMTFGIIWIIWI